MEFLKWTVQSVEMILERGRKGLKGHTKDLGLNLVSSIYNVLSIIT